MPRTLLVANSAAFWGCATRRCRETVLRTAPLGFRITVAFMLLAAIGCDPVHHISIRAVPSTLPESQCVAAALTPLGAARRVWCCVQPPRPLGVDLYAIEVGDDAILIDVPIAPWTTQPEVKVSWSTIGTLPDSQVAAVRNAIEAAYISLSTQCGLPAITEAKHDCWHMGCEP